jgi:protein SCO1/2
VTPRILRFVGIVLAALVIGLAFAWQYGLLDGSAGRPGTSGVARLGGSFTLVDQNGQTRTDAEFRGKLMLIYFGYTFCPDACPTALQVMTVALDMLGDKGKAVQPIFITIDPARDTAPRLKEYMTNFHPRFVALTGSPEAIARAAKAYRVYYAKAQGPGSGSDPKDYLMDHSSIIYLMDRKGLYITHFTHASNPEDLARAIRANL